MKRVLITGGTGFVGSNFTYKFLDLGFDVNLLVRSESNFWRIEEIKNKIKLHYVDLTNREETENFIKKLKPQIILHFATYGAYLGRQKDVNEAVKTNLLGTVNLLNACSKIDFECFINTGTNSEYGEKNHPMRENEILEPNNFYGATKAAASIYCNYLAKKLSLPLVTIRLFSVFGYFEERGRLVPSVIKAALNNENINLSTCEAVRDFIFIEDIIDFYLKTIEKISFIKGNIFNAGTGEQHTIEELAKIVKDLTNSPSEIVCGAVDIHQYEPKSWVSDISKAKNILGWKPNFSLEHGLQKNIEWFRKILDKNWY
ncbi:NAD-dependent epimerase/dehydratase family protein [Candidatus Wolfebacteria bacterium]|nr:NAD-dependent epimerase/dehydratase family protein [Candidatus Wolfebacteria bacterium]